MTDILKETLEDLLARLGIVKWDLLLVGDGSGSKWGEGAGWSCVALENNSLERKVFYGAVNNGTVNFAELMAYLAPLSWYAGRTDAEEGAAVAPRQVHIVTDSQYVQSMCSSSKAPKTHLALWTALNMFNRLGYRLHWHWMPREDSALNRYADVISKDARKQLQAGDLVDEFAKRKGIDPYKVNPWR